MKKITCLLALGLFVISCGKKEEVKEEVKLTDSYAVFGDSISNEGALSSAEMMAKFESLKEGDTVNVKFTSKINDVCQKKGCWMNVALEGDKSTFVKFKDYAFFVPMNAEDKDVIVEGKAFVSVESIDDLKHYAKDAGKSQEAIDSIVAPKTTYSFMANGVLISK
ncbi:DUF4920 domain-containing protein [Flavobacterium sp. N2270]|uniref:DUF4920 domain-containing protein n=1 Tax=Flavobacterium sp. N2270 TaxID=2986831 RepID=UPI002224A110|nr:DUF4920 domain-containing protein [Flavobacterium sp. N2270]